MSGESSKRSNLIDVTYNQLHSILCGRHEGSTTEQVLDYLKPRIDQLKNIAEPFGKPSASSKTKIQSGSVTLSDGIIIRVEEADKEFVLALSEHFQIDQIQALVLLRSFLYNQGLPSSSTATGDSSIVEELVEAITPFYFSERLSLLRLLPPLFRAKEDTEGAIYDVALDFLPRVIPQGRDFAKTLITEYLRRGQEGLPGHISTNPRSASKWAKQDLKEQLLMLELLFWTMWSHVPCDGPIVLQIYQAAYSSNLGSSQKNSALFLDEESRQIQQDIAALWILISIEVLELESLADGDGVEISATPQNPDIYTSSPDSLDQIHKLITSNSNSQHACAYLGWSFVLSRISLTAKKLKEVPDSYRPFLQLILNPINAREREPSYVSMSRTCLDPSVGFFQLLLSLLTQSPLFVSSIAWKTGSAVTDPNAVAYRSVLKGLLIALVELVPVENIPEMEAFHEVWISLFGRSESQSVAGICLQYWQADWNHPTIARRGVMDVARSRFPVQPRPLVRLLRAMTATGFLDTDPLSTSDHYTGAGLLTEERDICQRFVFFYLEKLGTFTQVIHTSECTGPNALYERVHERYGSASGPGGLTYSNVRPIRLPGGTLLPAKSRGSVLSNTDGEYLVVCWQLEHSGWKVLLDILTDYVNKRRVYSGINSLPRTMHITADRQLITKSLEDVGVEMNEGGDDELVKDILDLFRSLLQDNPTQSEQLVQSLESGDPVVSHTTTETQPPDLVQLTTLILEEALSRPTHSRGVKSGSRTELITSTISVLASMLSLPRYSNRVWLYIRSTSALFGQGSNSRFSSVALATERNTGHYTMTLSLLHLVQQMFHEASTSILVDDEKLQQLKEEVLLRAFKFVHTEVWVEHLGWRYAQIGDRYEIGRRVSALYQDVLRNAPPAIDDRPFKSLSQAVADILLFRATTSTINPLVTTITNGGTMLEALYTSRRYGDARRLVFLLESHLSLIRAVLNLKAKSPTITKLSLLEQALCFRTSDTASRAKAQPIDVLLGYVKERDVGNTVPLESIRVITALCTSFAASEPPPPTIFAHLSNPESSITSLVRIISHPYDEPELRRAIWQFMAIAVDKEPALAGLLVTGKFRTPADIKGKGKSEGATEDSSQSSAMQVAIDTLVGQKELWEVNPELLSSVSRFLYVVWQHVHELEDTLSDIRKDESFWSNIVGLGCQELGPVPEYRAEEFMVIDGHRHSNLHEGVVTYCHRTAAKAHALHIVALDVKFHLSKDGSTPNKAPSPPESFKKIESYFKSEEQLTELISEAFPSSYDPQVYDALSELLKEHFPRMSVEQLRWQEPVETREFGDDFMFSALLLLDRVQMANEDALPYVDEAERQLHSLNLNLSLVQSQTSHLESWRLLLDNSRLFLRSNSAVRPTILSLACAVSSDISKEKRSGDMMATIHGSRLLLLQSLLEVAWFQGKDTAAEVTSFVELVQNLTGITLNEVQTVAASFVGTITVPFHRTLLQIVYFCAKYARSLYRRPKTLNAEQRLKITTMLDAALSLVIDALRIVFVAARSRADTDLDRDMELLVAVFEQCTRPDLQLSMVHWLTRCQEMDIIKASLELFVRIDLVGLSDLSSLLVRKQPLYVPYLLLFHMVLAGIPSTASRLASEGVLSAYSNNQLSAAISAGKVDVTLPALPTDRSPAHQAYCWMVSVVSGIVRLVGNQTQYFNAEVCGFVQLYGDQISRTLSWTMNDPLTMPLLDEMEQVISLFFSVADASPPSQNSSVVTKVLQVFSTHALLLLQQLNYALNHPNHLASILEPVTSDERVQLEKESKIAEVSQRPFVSDVIRRLFRLSNRIVGTLVSISRAMDVLLDEPEDWPLHEALIVPHSKVVLGEPASIGTLSELANCAVDSLRDYNNQQSKSLVPSSTTKSTGSTTAPEAATLVRLIEQLLVYGTTQLAMSVRKPDAQLDASDVEMDEQQGDNQSTQSKERARRPRKSLGDRLRRGMTGEMASDLQSLLNKAKPVLQKSNELIGKDSVDLTTILIAFLRDHVGSV